MFSSSSWSSSMEFPGSGSDCERDATLRIDRLAEERMSSHVHASQNDTHTHTGINKDQRVVGNHEALRQLHLFSQDRHPCRISVGRSLSDSHISQAVDPVVFQIQAQQLDRVCICKLQVPQQPWRVQFLGISNSTTMGARAWS